jgi:hypothetical protein
MVFFAESSFRELMSKIPVKNTRKFRVTVPVYAEFEFYFCKKCGVGWFVKPFGVTKCWRCKQGGIKLLAI